MAQITLLLDDPSKRDEIGVMGQKVREVITRLRLSPGRESPSPMRWADAIRSLRSARMLLGPDMVPLVDMAKEVSAKMMQQPAISPT